MSLIVIVLSIFFSVYDISGAQSDRSVVVLNDIHIDIMDYIVPASCTDAEFRTMWAEFEWENKVSFCSHYSWTETQTYNPILTGGGGGGQFDPPLHEIRNCLATAADRDTPFCDFFLSSLTHLLIPSLRKNRTIGREVTWRFVLARRPKICPKSAFCICLCTKHMEITDFLKMH